MSLKKALSGKQAAEIAKNYLESLEYERGHLLSVTSDDVELSDAQKARIARFRQFDPKDLATIARDAVALKKWEDAHIEAMRARLQRGTRELNLGPQALAELRTEKEHLFEQIQELDPGATHVADEQDERTVVAVRKMLQNEPGIALRVAEDLLPNLRADLEERRKQFIEDLSLIEQNVTAKAISELQEIGVAPKVWLNMLGLFEARAAPGIALEQARIIVERENEIGELNGDVQSLRAQKEAQTAIALAAQKEKDFAQSELRKAEQTLADQTSRREQAESASAASTERAEKSKLEREQAEEDKLEAQRRLESEEAAKLQLETDLGEAKSQIEAEKRSGAEALASLRQQLEQDHEKRLAAVRMEASADAALLEQSSEDIVKQYSDALEEALSNLAVEHNSHDETKAELAKTSALLDTARAHRVKVVEAFTAKSNAMTAQEQQLSLAKKTSASYENQLKEVKASMATLSNEFSNERSSHRSTKNELASREIVIESLRDEVRAGKQVSRYVSGHFFLNRPS